MSSRFVIHNDDLAGIVHQQEIQYANQLEFSGPTFVSVEPGQYQPSLDIPSAPYVFPDKAGAFDPIRIEDATDPETVIASRSGNFTFNSKLSEYGAAVVASLERELTKNGFRVAADASKVIRIDVIDVAMAYPKKYRCDINLTVDVGEKRIGIATESEPSALYDNAIDASIGDAVRRILGNEEVAAFLTDRP